MQKSIGKSELVKYTLISAPWTLVASFAQPISNYLIILLLSKSYGLAAGGQFRLLLSIFGILTIFTLVDSGRIVVRYLVLEQRGVVWPLLVSRVRWGLLGLAAGVTWAFVLYQRGDELALPVLVLALLLPVGKSADLYAQINQARMAFPLSAVYSTIKYGSVIALAVVCIGLNLDITYFLCTYFVVLFGFNMYFLSRHREAYEAAGPDAKKYVREGLELSGSGVFPIALEQVDKFIVTYFFGLETLALYTIGVSTGRLLLNFVKPVLTIYFAMLVNHRPDPLRLLGAFTLLTAFGVACAWALKFYFAYVLGPDYLSAYPIAAVVLSGLGLFFVAAIVYYSSVYHKEATIRIPTATNIITFVVVVSYLFASVLLGGNLALLLLAASYPLRDLITIAVTAHMSRRMRADGKPSLVS